MQIGIPMETVAGESRVAATPETVKKLVGAGHSVVIQKGAGRKAAYLDDAYTQVGATIAEDAYQGASQTDTVDCPRRCASRRSRQLVPRAWR